MFLQNAWYVGAWGTEVGRQNLMRRTLLNEPVVFYRLEDGSPVALADKCAHRHAPLSEGKLVGDRIQCPYHGLEYNAAGDCVRVPGQSTVPPACRVRSYPTVERYQWIWVWMGDPALADPDEIEDFHWMDDPDWRAKGELMHLEADYRLLIENLLDLSHLTFIHPTTIGTDAVAETPMKFKRGDRHVTVTRWVMDSVPPPFFEKAGGFASNEHVDRWQSITWTSPSFVKLDVGAAKAGTGAREGDRSQGFTMRNLNAITPETDRTTHYFWAQAHDFRTDQPWFTDLLVANVHEAFLEDLEIIGLQQRNIDAGTTPARVDINHDGGGVQAVRMLNAMIDSENDPTTAQAAE
ncbi:MAG: aromatic ring-hydroxylating dioxygenase subunit alpha [Pseudomonadota bacterium]|nr:aromatic ring-hydroxylating dioxygenase subunit alpha [Pseudomonadota bacterium]